MTQDLLIALNQTFTRANTKRTAAANHLDKCENRVVLLQDRLRVVEEQARFNASRLDEIDRQHNALLDHYKSFENKPPFIVEQLQELAKQRTLADQKVKDTKKAEEDYKRDLEEAQAALAFAHKQEREAANEIVAINQEIQRANNRN